MLGWTGRGGTTTTWETRLRMIALNEMSIRTVGLVRADEITYNERQRDGIGAGKEGVWRELPSDDLCINCSQSCVTSCRRRRVDINGRLSGVQLMLAALLDLDNSLVEMPQQKCIEALDGGEGIGGEGMDRSRDLSSHIVAEAELRGTQVGPVPVRLAPVPCMTASASTPSSQLSTILSAATSSFPGSVAFV